MAGQLQLLVFPLVAKSYMFTFSGLRPLLGATWPWMGVVYITKQVAEISGNSGSISSLDLLSFWIAIIANLVASSAVSVLCHRIIILSEQPLGVRSLHFGYREIRYVLALLGFSLLTILLVTFFTTLSYLIGLKTIGVNFGTAIAIIIILVLYGRLSLAFPDLAVADGRLPWHIWHISHGHVLRIILGATLSGVPLALAVQQLITAASFLQEEGLVSIAMLVEFLSLVVTFLAIMSSAAFLSFTYKVLILGNLTSSKGNLVLGE